MSTKIKHIVLQVGDKEIQLSPNEARELYNELHQMYGSQPYIYPNWQWQPTTITTDGTHYYDSKITITGALL
jgi:hypothetical protein